MLARSALGATTRHARLMLLGRKDERLALDRLFAQARDGRSGVLALVGEPGIGKTALLEHAAESAQGMRILRCRGIESEAVIPFAGLAELLRPVLSALDRIPAPQATALAGALALGPAGARSLRDRGRDAQPAVRQRRGESARAARRRRALARSLERRGAAVRRATTARRSDRAGDRGARGRALAAGRRRPTHAATGRARPRGCRRAAVARGCSSGRARAPVRR